MWDLLLCLFGGTWVMANSVTAMLASWRSLGKLNSGEIWMTAPCFM